ncbi:NirD/YgiW/YdeI family stress tolerance protein [Collimonas sp. H4R21]|uniref:NirD/YgiW/YdeI family stress tolerance protein n=1 Tax=Collimonas rhizosphaerae TaxID=3126357 RepID=A0ABU9PQL0_9BURK
MNRINKLIVISVLAASSTIVFAQGYNGPTTTAAPANKYAGPSTVPSMTAKQLLANGADKQYVTLTGKLVRHTGGKHYILADTSGEIPVEISPKRFPANQTIDANTTVELAGKFDKERFGTSKLEVEQIKVVSK